MEKDKCENCGKYTEIVGQGLCEGCYTSKMEFESAGGENYYG